MRRLCLIIPLFFLSVSCSRDFHRNGESTVIRYVDLSRVYGYAAANETGAPDSVKSKDSDEKVKARIYGKIKTAISNVARRENADFVLNTADTLLYSRNVYDITDDVIREYKKINDISSPVIK